MLPPLPIFGVGRSVAVHGLVSHEAHSFAVGLTSSPFHTTRGLLRSPGSAGATSADAPSAAAGDSAPFAALAVFGSGHGGGARHPSVETAARGASRNEKCFIRTPLCHGLWGSKTAGM